MQRGHDRSRRPRQDDADGGADEGVGGQGLDVDLRVVRPGGEGVGEPGPARPDQDPDDRDEPRGILDRQAALRACRLPRPCRLREEHDHRRGADGRRDPGGVGGRRSDAADARAHPAGAPGGRALHRGVPEQGRRGRRPRAARSGRARGARASDQVPVPGRQGAGDPRRGDQGAQRREGRVRRRGDPASCYEALDTYRAAAGAPDRPAVPDADRGRVLDLGPRHGGDRADRARQDQGRRGSRDRRAARHPEVGGDRRRDVPQAAGRGRGGRQRRLPAARHRQGRGRARPGAVQAGLGEAAQEVQGGGLHPDQGGGRPSHAVLQQLPSAVLLPDDRRDRAVHAAGGHRDGHAGRQRDDGRRADHADRDGGEAALRHPRGRQDRRRRRRRHDH